MPKPISRPDRWRLVLPALLWAGWALPAPAAGPADRLDTIQRFIDETRTQESELATKTSTLVGEMGKLRRQSVTIAARTQSLETEMSLMESRLTVLAADEVAKTTSLDRRRHQLARMLAALQRIARHPPTTLIALPAPPGDTVRSALLLRAAVPAIEQKAASLKRELVELALVRDQLAEARRGLSRTGVSLDRERRQLAALAERKTEILTATRAEGRAARQRIETLAAEARNLSDLLSRLAKARLQAKKRGEIQRRKQRREQHKVVLTPPRRQVPPATPKAKPAARRASPSQVLASLAPPAPSLRDGLPARGRVIRLFGQHDGLDHPAKGITIETRRTAQVIAPRRGEVVFAGPFQGFGNLLIIEHSAGYHILLAGLARIDAAIGDRVLAGEPVGVMEGKTDGKPSLYVELRRKGDPINPLPWLAAGRTRTKG